MKTRIRRIGGEYCISGTVNTQKYPYYQTHIWSNSTIAGKRPSFLAGMVCSRYNQVPWSGSHIVTSNLRATHGCVLPQTGMITGVARVQTRRAKQQLVLPKGKYPYKHKLSPWRCDASPSCNCGWRD